MGEFKNLAVCFVDVKSLTPLPQWLSINIILKVIICKKSNYFINFTDWFTIPKIYIQIFTKLIQFY